MLWNRNDFTINGLRLGQHIDTLAHLVENVSKSYEGFAPGLKQWDWTSRREFMTTPLRVQFVDGLISQVSGSELTVGGHKFDRGAEQDEILRIMPTLIIEDGNHLKYLRLNETTFQLTVRLRKRFNWYLLRDEKLSQKWISRYQNDSAQ